MKKENEERRELVCRRSIKSISIVRVDVDQVVDRMMVGVRIVQRGTEGGGGDSRRGWWMIDRLHRGNGRHLIGGTGRHLVHGIGRGHRAP